MIILKENEIYDAKICSKCGTGFGFVKIISKTDKGTIFHLDLDLVSSKT